MLRIGTNSAAQYGLGLMGVLAQCQHFLVRYFLLCASFFTQDWPAVVISQTPWGLSDFMSFSSFRLLRAHMTVFLQRGILVLFKRLYKN